MEFATTIVGKSITRKSGYCIAGQGHTQMKTFRQTIEEKQLNEGGDMYPADEMTMKELKIACYSAQNILERLEDGGMIQRWQISAIVKASEELASVYTSMSAEEYDDEEEDTINVFFGYDVLADEVVAIFPDEIADYKGNITCYTHNGQHSACSKEYAKELKPASGNEYRPLYKELIGQGYSKLNILKKLSIR